MENKNGWWQEFGAANKVVTVLRFLFNYSIIHLLFLFLTNQAVRPFFHHITIVVWESIISVVLSKVLAFNSHLVLISLLLVMVVTVYNFQLCHVAPFYVFFLLCCLGCIQKWILILLMQFWTLHDGVLLISLENRYVTPRYWRNDPHKFIEFTTSL